MGRTSSWSGGAGWGGRVDTSGAGGASPSPSPSPSSSRYMSLSMQVSTRTGGIGTQDWQVGYSSRYDGGSGGGGRGGGGRPATAPEVENDNGSGGWGDDGGAGGDLFTAPRFRPDMLGGVGAVRGGNVPSRGTPVAGGRGAFHAKVRHLLALNLS